MKQLNGIMRIRVNGPPGPDKGDPNKVWCYETIDIVDYSEVYAFEKRSKKRYPIEDSNLNQLDFMFTFS